MNTSHFYHLQIHNYDMQSAAIAWTYSPTVAMSLISLTLWVTFTAFFLGLLRGWIERKKTTGILRYFLNSFKD